MTKPTLTRFAAALALAAASLVAWGTARAAYVLTEFSLPGATSTSLFDVNNSGQMVGYSLAGTGMNDFATGFIYDGGSFTTIAGPAGAVSSAALGISDSGTVIGTYNLSAGVDGSGNTILGASQGFIYAAGVYTTFTVAGATDTTLRAISPDGRYISGYYATPTVAGIGFVYDTLGASLTTVSGPASAFTIAQGINSSYTLVGSDIIGGTPVTRPGFTYDIATATRTDVSITGAQRTALRTIDDAGVVGGWFIDAGGTTHGFIGSVAAFESLDFAGADGTFVEGSNNAGVVVGNFLGTTRSGAYVATRVPEPATLALVLVGLATLAVRRRTLASR